MASGRIKGITIEIGGDTKQLNTALKGVDSQLSSTKTALRDVEKLLKLDPTNVELLSQKQKLLTDAIEATKERLETLKGAFSDNMSPDEVDALNREIIATEQSLANFEAQAAAAGDATGDMGEDMSDAGDAAEEANEGWSMSKQVLADLASEGLDKACEAAKKLAGALKDAIDDSSGYADDILTMSTKYNISTDALQEYAYMAELVDVDLDTVTGSMTKLTRQMGAADSGTASAVEAFKNLGISIYDSNGELRNADEVFLEAIDALGNVENVTERDALAMDLFGKSAQDLNPLIAQGSEGIASFAQEAHDMGAVLDEEALASLGAVDDGFQRMEQAGIALKNTIGTALAPVITAITGAITNLSMWFQNLDPNMQKTILTIVGVVAAIGPAIAIITKVIATIQAVSTVISGVGAVMNVVSMGPMGLIVAGIAAIIAAGVLLATHWDEIKEWAANLWEKITEIWNNIKESIANAWNNIKEKTTQAWNNIKTGLTNTWNNLKTKVTETWNNIKEKTAETWNKVKTSLTNTWNNLKEKASDTWSNIKSGVEEKFSAVKTFLIDNVWGPIKDNVASTWAAMKQNVEDNGGGIKGVISSLGENYKEIWSGIFSTLNDITGGKLGEAWETVKTVLGNIASSFTEKFDAIKDFVSGAIDKIKSFFDFSWSLPHIAMPHFYINGDFSIKPPRVPSIGVDWYASAYNNPVLFTQPTVLGTSSGLKGFGDGSGAEIVIGLNKLQELVGGSGSVTNNITIMQQPGQSPAQLADMVARRIQQNVDRAKAVTA